MFSSASMGKRLCSTVLVMAVGLLVWLALLAPASTASNACDSSSSSSSSSLTSNSSYQQSLSERSDVEDLRRRVGRALDKTDCVSLTEEGRLLRNTVNGVLSEEECLFLVEKLSPRVFVDAGGYESTSNKYNAPRKGYSGIGLDELSRGENPILRSKGDYERFLEFRERIRSRTEQALNLYPGTLKIDYTHISQKTEGGTHRPHADNCFHYYRDINGGSSINAAPSLAATLDPTKDHPYSNRVAASILYLNDNGFEGGEFYWANRSSEEGKPETIVPPKTGRMAVFTSGIENLHGALPVRESPETENNGYPSRRLVLAMWYVAAPEDNEERVPEYGHITSGNTKGDSEEEADPNRTLRFEIPVDSIEIGGLRLALGMFLVKKQNTPNRNSWKVNQGSNEHTLLMIFGDQSAMISIILKPRSIVVSRHTDAMRPPSLVYQLQESVLLHGILNELERLAFADDATGKRFVRLEKASIDKARSTLPTR